MDKLGINKDFYVSKIILLVERERKREKSANYKN